MIFEILNDAGDVENTIVADLEFVEANYPGRYREVVQPDVPTPEPQPVPQILSKVAFRFRLTDAEYVGILQAAKVEIAVQAWLETFNMVTQINLENPRTVAGVQMLVDLELLTEERAAEILTTPVADEERP